MDNEIVSGAWRGQLGQGLAPRELQCVLSVAQGMTAKEIAKVFGVTPGTVGKRIEAAMYKLGVHRRAALVAEAMRRQIISPMCLVLAGLLAMNAVTNVGSNDPQRRERRPSHTRIAQTRITRKSESLERDV